jgi:hypothetical protein
MRVWLSVLLLGALTLAGCAGKTGTVPGKASPASQKLIVTPEAGATGTVVLVNPAARCVVLNFPLSWMPALEQRLSLYRRGLKVGEVQVTGPQREDNIVADLIAGEAQVGDEARAQ